MDFVYAQEHAAPFAAVFGAIQNVEDDYELLRGVPRLDGFPSDARVDMDEEFGVRLDDVVKTLGSILVISERLRAFLDAEHLPNTEMLPVTVYDPKGRAVDAPYVVFHQTHLQDALALDQVEAKMNPINPAIIRSVDRIVLRPEALDPEVRVFRLARYPKPVLFERGLAERITAEGFTGIAFGELDAYDPFSIL